jgi:ABC-type sugar transport system ATPase subunit
LRFSDFLQEAELAVITLKNVKKSFGSVNVIGNVNLTIGEGELVIFVGPSGSGKAIF